MRTIALVLLMVLPIPARADAIGDAMRDLRSADVEVARRAIRRLARSGRAARPALLALVRAGGREPLTEEVQAMLGKVGAPPADLVPTLGAMLWDDNPRVRPLAAACLGWRAAGTPAAGMDRAVAYALSELRDSNPKRRRLWAITAIGSFRGPFEVAEPAIRAALGDADWEVRQGGLLALGSSLPAWQAKPLPSIDRALPLAIAALLRDPNLHVRSRAAMTLGERGAAAAAAVAPLTIALRRDADNMVRSDAAVALGYIGPPARVALSRLWEAVSPTEDALVRVRATAAIGFVAAPSADVSRRLGALLDDDNMGVRTEAARALRCQGSAAHAELARLRKLGDHPDQQLREAALEAIRAITSSGR